MCKKQNKNVQVLLTKFKNKPQMPNQNHRGGRVCTHGNMLHLKKKGSLFVVYFFLLSIGRWKLLKGG